MATTSRKKAPAKKAAARKPVSSSKTTPKAAAPRTSGKRPAAKQPAAKQPAAKKAAAKKAAAKKAAAKKAAAKRPAAKQTSGKRPAAKQAAGKRPAATRTAPKKGSAARSPAVARTGATLSTRHAGPDPDGYFVARIRGEDGMRDAPHLMTEPGGWDDEETAPAPSYDEELGELPWTYGDDLLVALPRDPRTLFVYWDQGRATLEAAFAHLDHPRVQLWIFARGEGWERVAALDVALEARGWYVHDLEPGRTYRAELHVLGGGGADRMLPGPSNATGLPPRGPSPIVDDRYVKLPWGVALPTLVGAGMPGGPFSEAARALLARLSGWDRFGSGSAVAPTSPTGPVGRGGN